MKVVHVVRQFHPSVGGLEDVVLNVALHHRDNSQDQVEVVTLDRIFSEPEVRLPAQTAHREIPVRRLPWSGSLSLIHI